MVSKVLCGSMAVSTLEAIMLELGIVKEIEVEYLPRQKDIELVGMTPKEEKKKKKNHPAIKKIDKKCPNRV